MTTVKWCPSSPRPPIQIQGHAAALQYIQHGKKPLS